MNASLIDLENVSFRYPKASEKALDGVSLSIPKGSFFALLGPNGAGKTTLLRLLCGRFSHYDGRVNVHSEVRGEHGLLDSKSYGVLLENPGVYPKLSIEEYLSYFAGFYGMGEDACLLGGKARSRVEELAERLSLPALSTRMSTLSLGNRQKVQILRALIHAPKLLILDEPVANLDPSARDVVWKLISEWRKREGGTAIVCSHILAEMESEATDFAIINGGRVLKVGNAEIASYIDDAPQNATMDFTLSVKSFVTPEQIAQVLNNAGFGSVVVTPREISLADIYRNTISKS